MADESITAATATEETRKKDESVQSDLTTKKKMKQTGVLARVWNGVFGRRGEDYEKRLQYLSMEEATVHSRMKRRAQRWRKTARNVILCSVVAEVAAVVYAILTTKSLDFSWQMRALRVMPMFAFPGVSYVVYSTLGSYTKMRDRKDQKTLESLRAERQDKINELKEKTNYYTTQQLIQRYDLDPAAKAAAATVLASKLGAHSGLKVFLGDESKPIASSGKSNDAELVPSDGLRNRKNPIGRGHSTGSSVSEQYFGDETTSQENFPAGQDTAFQGQRYGELYKGTIPIEGGWISRLAAMLVGEDPSQSYALICGSCHMHNALARKEDFPYITYYCPHCHALNGLQQSDENRPSPGSLSVSTSSAPGDVHIGCGSSNMADAEGSRNPTPVQEQYVEAIDQKEPSEMT